MEFKATNVKLITEKVGRITVLTNYVGSELNDNNNCQRKQINSVNYELLK